MAKSIQFNLPNMGYSFFRGRKHFAGLLAIVFCTQIIFAQSTLRGIVSDGKTNFADASVRILAGSDRKFIVGGLTDSLGKYQLQAPPGVYLLSVYYPSFSKGYSARVELVEGQTTVHHVMVSTHKSLPEAEIVDFRVPLRDQIMSGKGLIDFNEPPKKPAPIPAKKKN